MGSKKGRRERDEGGREGNRKKCALCFTILFLYLTWYMCTLIIDYLFEIGEYDHLNLTDVVKQDIYHKSDSTQKKINAKVLQSALS